MVALDQVVVHVLDGDLRLGPLDAHRLQLEHDEDAEHVLEQDLLDLERYLGAGPHLAPEQVRPDQLLRDVRGHGCLRGSFPLWSRVPRCCCRPGQALAPAAAGSGGTAQVAEAAASSASRARPPAEAPGRAAASRATGRRASRSTPVATPIRSNIQTTSSVATLPVAPGAKGQPPRPPAEASNTRRPA